MLSNDDPCAGFVADLGGKALDNGDAHLKPFLALLQQLHAPGAQKLEGKAAEQGYAEHEEEKGAWWLALDGEEGSPAHVYQCTAALPQRPMINLLHKGCGAGIKRHFVIAASNLSWIYARTPEDWAGPYFVEKEEA